VACVDVGADGVSVLRRIGGSGGATAVEPALRRDGLQRLEDEFKRAAAVVERSEAYPGAWPGR
jgi:hypothetical protein